MYAADICDGVQQLVRAGRRPVDAHLVLRLAFGDVPANRCCAIENRIHVFDCFRNLSHAGIVSRIARDAR